MHLKKIDGDDNGDIASTAQIVGLALGRLGMRLGDLRRLTVEEFESIVDEWRREKESAYQDNWERMRMLATITIQPHTTKSISPRSLLPFSWDSTSPKQEAPTLTKEQQRQRFIELMKKREE